MADLDKKIQKAAPDLVQSVLEAQERRSPERVDILITNAIKQLKMSRFKPDQTTCISLTYLARVNPKVFRQSTVIKDTLKSLLRRDNGPANIKGKNDIVLPVLAANILLACCDSAEVRTMVLNKIDQWLGGSNGQKANELIQHLLATLCMKCQADQQTIDALIEMRNHWLQYLEDNLDLYGPIPVDLCANIRKLLHSESNCASLLGHLNFLIKHDNDIDGVGDEISRFILDRPLSLNSMLKQDNSGPGLYRALLKVFIKFLEHLLSSSKTDSTSSQQEICINEDSHIGVVSSQASQEGVAPVNLKQEPPAEKVCKQESKEPKQEIAPEMKPAIAETLKNEPHQIKDEAKAATTYTPKFAANDTKEQSSSSAAAASYLYIKLSDSQKVIKLGREILEALLNLISWIDDQNSDTEEFRELLRSWLITDESGLKRISDIYEDLALTKPFNLHERLRHRLIQCETDLLVEFGLRNADTNQLVALLQQFGLPLSTIERISKQLGAIKDTELLRSKIEDLPYFDHLMDFYHELGSKRSRELQIRLTSSH